VSKWKPVSNGIYVGDGTVYIGEAWTPFEAGRICAAHNAEPGAWSAVPPIVDGYWWYKDNKLKYPVILRLRGTMFASDEYGMKHSVNYFLVRPGARWFTEPVTPPEGTER